MIYKKLILNYTNKKYEIKMINIEWKQKQKFIFII